MFSIQIAVRVTEKINPQRLRRILIRLQGWPKDKSDVAE
jgi:hypothetical protein